MAANDQILKLILEIHTTVQSLDKKVDDFGNRLESHLQEDAAWQAKLLKKIPPPSVQGAPNGKLNGKAHAPGKGKRKTS